MGRKLAAAESHLSKKSRGKRVSRETAIVGTVAFRQFVPKRSCGAVDDSNSHRVLKLFQRKLTGALIGQ
jgi:hypothetical protein